MASLANGMRRSRSAFVTRSRSRSGGRVAPASQKPDPRREPARTPKQTVFDLLYDSYLPFRLYTDYMLGTSPAELARQFALSEHWVTERIEAVRLCGKQVRLNLLDAAV